MRRSPLLPSSGAALLAAALFVAPGALALPTPGAHVPHAVAEDPDGMSIDLAWLRGRPTLVLYEDKDTSSWNQDLRDQLARLAQRDPRSRVVAVVPVVDVGAYDFWPARGFARGAVRQEAERSGMTLYCDWGGGFRQALSLRRGTSSTILLDRAGKVIFAREGKLSPDDARTLVRLLLEQVGG